MKAKRILSFALMMAAMLTAGCSADRQNAEDKASGQAPGGQIAATLEYPELTMIGRSSVKLKTTDGTVIYIDPYAGDDSAYSEPADYIFVTHQDHDHNKVAKVEQKADTQIYIGHKDINAGDKLSFDNFKVEAVYAYNKNHPKGDGCGYIFSVDGIVLYHSGDTSMIDEMNDFGDRGITYALLCADGVYNMGPDETMAVAKLIDAKHVIPMHTSGSGDYDEKNDQAVALDNAVHMKPGDVISLKP